MEKVEDMNKNEVSVNIKDGIFDLRAVNMVKILDEKYCIIEVYKVLIDTNVKSYIEDSDIYFDNKKDIIRSFPGNEYVTQYQLVDKNTGFVPDEIKSNDEYAFSCIDEVVSAYMSYLAPILGITPNNNEIVMKLNTEYKGKERQKELLEFKLIDPEYNVIRRKAYIYDCHGILKVRNSKKSEDDILVDGFSIVDEYGKQVEGTKALYKNINSAIEDYNGFSTVKRLIITTEDEKIRAKESFARCVELYKDHLENDYKNLFG